MIHRLLILLLAGLALAAPVGPVWAGKTSTNSPAIVKGPSEPPMQVLIVQGTGECGAACPQWIAAQGEITAGTPARFAKVLRQMGTRRLPVILNSPGGSISASLAIGRMIRKNGLDVAIGRTSIAGCPPLASSCKAAKAQEGVYGGTASTGAAYCNSACHLVLAAGRQRLVPAGSSVGVHQARTVWTREIVTYRERYRIVAGKKHVIDRRVVSRKPAKSKVTYGYDKSLRRTLNAYYKAMGVDPAVLGEAEKASFKDINFLSSADLDRLRLRTSGSGLATLVGKGRCQKSPLPANCQAAAATAVTQ
jgi:hypothetical protein